MRPRHGLVFASGFFFASLFSSSIAAANEFALECACPARCGKVCKLVCEKKKLTAICFGCECDEICIPGPSRAGGKHCATCNGECTADACTDCQNHPPQCEFCWRDWFACGCARPRTVKVLTKYQAEKEIGWYHWEVTDAACCDGVAQLYKPAPADAEVGDVVAVSEEEWGKLGPVLTPEQYPGGVLVDNQPPATPTDGSVAPAAPPARISIAERLQGLFRE